MVKAVILAVVVFTLSAPCPSWAQVPRINLSSIGPTFSSPVLVTSSRDGSGRQFVVEQGGRIMIAGAPSAVFLDIRSRLVAGGERGLLGLAFHPQFASNRRFFVNYTRQSDGATVVAEYRTLSSNPNAGDPNSESILLIVPQPYENHNGGMVEFGPDGFLYVGMGDGGSGNDPQNRAQNPTELLGKMLRINVDTRQVEIFASGLRNPWRFSFDRATGELWAGDVGQNAREEVDVIRRGGNYGWRVFEGSLCTGLGPGPCNSSSYIQPITEYVNGSNGRCAITGGYVYRGSRGTLPYGSYVFGDYCSGEIFMWKDGVQNLLLDTTLNISSFGEDDSGELYVVALGGTIQRINNPDAVILTQRNFSLASGASTAFTAGEGVSSASVGYARVQTGAGGLPAGIEIFGQRSGGTIISETSIALSPLIQSGRLYVDTIAPTSTALAIANPNATDVMLTFFFTDSAGQDFGQGTFILPAGAQLARFVHEQPFKAIGGFRGTMTFSASALVSAAAFQGFTNERSEVLFSNEPIAAIAATPDEILFPHFADGGGWSTQLVLMNPTDVVLSGTLQVSRSVSLNGQNGSNFPYSVPPRSFQRFATGGAGSGVNAGFVRVTPDASSAAPSGMAVFRLRQGAVGVASAIVPAGQSGTAFNVYAELAGALQSGLAIANTGSSSASVSLALVPAGGAGSVSTATLSIAAGGQRSLFLSEVLAVPASSQPFRGLLRVTSTAPIGVTGFRGRTNERGEFLIAATPPLEDANASLSSELLFPHAVVGGGYEAQFVLVNVQTGQAQAGTVYFFDQSGQSWPLTLR